MALIGVVAALAAGGGCQTMVCDRRVADRRCLNGRVGSCIHHAALRWRVSHELMRRRAWCESRLDPRAYNPSSGASGIFQFLPSTFASTPYRRHSIWSPHWNSLAAAWMEHVGRGSEWACR